MGGAQEFNKTVSFIPPSNLDSGLQGSRQPDFTRALDYKLEPDWDPGAGGELGRALVGPLQDKLGLGGGHQNKIHTSIHDTETGGG